MKLSDIVKLAAVGALVYGAYKLGERNEKKRQNYPEPKNLNEYEDAEVVPQEEKKEQTEADFIKDLINSLRGKPNKTSKDRDTLELLEIKLKQLLK